ncbi:MAG: LTA synthase family protein [Pseudobutyrivibrio sp.]|nr:LTA synthase family protein [Pseudobutyrivibrio sp.]
MKKILKNIKSFHGKLLVYLRKPFVAVAESKAVARFKSSKFYSVHRKLWDEFPMLMHGILAMAMCFVIEWLSKHSFVDACGFVVNHTGPYLYNSYLIFAILSLVFLAGRQTFTRILLIFVFSVLGVTNCIVLLNRVTPFGYTDLYMITDLLTMQDSQYFTAEQAMLIMIALVIFIFLMVVKYRKEPKVVHSKPFWMRFVACAALIGLIYPGTLFLRSTGILTTYFGNLAQGYRDYGFLYGFSTSVFDRGMKRPLNYGEKAIDWLVKEDSKVANSINPEKMPNVVVILLESIYDVSEVEFMTTSEDPIPFLRSLEENYSSGHCIVPVVGAGTCNSEFEVLTGMSCSFFGPGEYPQKTILKEIESCESYANVLGELGYGTHVVHNNGGNFYSRAHAFSLMGFDSFTCKEMLDITEYTPLGSWPTDDILTQATLDSMNSTEGSDFVYTIMVGSHGAYPEYVVEENPRITVECEGKTEGQTNAWNYYVNRIHDDDDFLRSYIEALDARGEDTLVIMFGDHLPTMGLTENEVATGSLYKTKYFTWNNFGMEEINKDLTTYQLVSEFLNRLGIHNGTFNSYHQTQTRDGHKAGTIPYMLGLEMLQYDQLYGDRYVYDGEDKYPASDIEMGINDVTIDKCYFFDGNLNIYGTNFTKWSKVYVNGEKVPTSYKSGQVLSISADLVETADHITVCQVGSSNTIFRESNRYTIIRKPLNP